MGQKVEASFFEGEVNIAINDTRSEAIPSQALAQGGFILPSSFTGTTITFEVSADGVTYVALHKNTADTPESITVTAGKAYAFPISLFPFPFVKLVSGSAEAAARTIKIVSKY